MWRTLTSWLTPVDTPCALHGRTSDVEGQLQRLLDAPQGSWLVIEVEGVDDAFLQFTAGPDSIRIDHPLITPSQATRETAFRKVLADAGLRPHDASGSDGSRFLDCDIERDAAAAALLTKRIMEVLFDVQPNSPLRFTGEGLPPTA